MSHVPDGFFGPERPGAVSTTYEALSLSPFWCGVRLYQTVLGSLPLVTYRRGEDGSNKRAEDLDAYEPLHDRPNPAMTRAVFFELLARALFLEREFVALVRKTEDGQFVGVYPGKLNPDAPEVIKKWWKEEYGGAAATAKLPVTSEGGEFVRFQDITTEDAKIIAALSASVDD
ncbi:phage portal protein [bacterium]|nr:phage portal protein [bacterium]